MLKNNKKKDSGQSAIGNKGGFTIIEVLIVLAIAGLILLIVFLAVPGLQRNSRNTAIKNDAQNVLGGVSEFQSANNGTLPSTIQVNSATPGKVEYTRSGANTTGTNIQPGTIVNSATSAPASTAPELGTINISIGFRCDGTASPRAVAAVFSIETSGGTARQCQDA